MRDKNHQSKVSVVVAAVGVVDLVEAVVGPAVLVAVLVEAVLA